MNYKVLLLMICVLGSPLVSSISAGVKDQTAIVIDERVITLSEYQHKKNIFARLNGVRFQNADQRRAFDREFRQMLIDQELQLHMGRLAGVALDYSDHQQILKGLLVKHQVADESALRSKLSEQGVDLDTLMVFAREQYLVQKIQSLVLRERVQVGDGELDKKYAAFVKEHQILTVEDIYFNTEGVSESRRSRLQQLAIQVSSFWKKGIYFDHTVPKQSRLLSFKRQKLSDFPDEFQMVIRDMKSSDVSDPIVTGNGYHVLKLLKRTSPSQSMPSKSSFQQQLTQEKLTAAVPGWISELKEQIYVDDQLGQ